MRTINLIIIVFLALLLICSISSAKIIYVDEDATGANNGSSWENAYAYLQDALADANDSDKPVEVRVAQGIYTPDKGAGIDINDIYTTFKLINGVTLAGGYAGAADPNERDIELYKTVLSGDLLGNDIPVADPYDLFPESEQDSRYDNSYNVVIAINTDETAILDGFTITGGIASFYSYNNVPQKNGGGLYCYKSKPVIANCTFTFNAAYDGGALYSKNSSPTIINCRFEKNAAIPDQEEPGSYGAYGGGGGGLNNNNSNPVLTSCIFIENHAFTGGGILDINNSNPTMTDCKFTRNSAKYNTGGGMENYFCSPILTGCLFEGNSAYSGGGMHNFFNKPILTGCAFIGNYASSDGGGIANEDSEPDLTGCEFISNTASSGGAISNDSCMNLVITNCIFTDNSARNGGAMCNIDSDLSIIGSLFAGNAAFEGGATQNWFSETTITNCLFTGNASQQGCSIQNYECNLTLTNCTISGNAMRIYDSGISDSSQDNQDTSGETPDLHGMPDDDSPNFTPDPGYLECTNCIIRDDVNSIFNNYGESINVRYSNILGGFDGPGNIDAKPLFVNPGYWVDANDPNIIVEPNDPNAVWINGDYHLKSQAGRFNSTTGSWVIDDVTSQCIDAGDPNSPVGDEPEPNGGRINMGAYGGISQASKSSPD